MPNVYKKLQNNEKLWYRFRHIADEICKEYGLYYDPKPELGKTNNYHYYQKEQSDLHSNPNTFDFNFRGLNLKYKTDDGVFSKKYIDFGSQYQDGYQIR